MKAGEGRRRRVWPQPRIATMSEATGSTECHGKSPCTHQNTACTCCTTVNVAVLFIQRLDEDYCILSQKGRLRAENMDLSDALGGGGSGPWPGTQNGQNQNSMWPGQPPQPNQPAWPGQPPQPNQPAWPGQPPQPNQPAWPGQPPTAPQAAWPGQPSAPSPSWPGQPGQPGQPPAPNPSWPGQPGQPGQPPAPNPSWPGQPGQPGQPPAPNPSWPAQPTQPSQPGHHPTPSPSSWPGQPGHPLTVPYSMSLPRGVNNKLLITISGQVKPHPKKITINLLRGKDVALHLNPRFDEGGKKVIVRNSLLGGKWGKEERALGHFPFSAGQTFEIKILCTSNEFKVAVNKAHLLEFRYRIQELNQINQLTIHDDITLTAVNIESLP
ncbi:hypothetical protein AAFF_G00412220 [Aldrovandia affinis]|uniref:Galectin n=1 Tax=Aldrovandia affinis TaxID=143900 RepID=A0AAD7WK06_9TELE|nr:hypothetical protein AAFF_G00412220 [Aldrovandia affinis]